MNRVIRRTVKGVLVEYTINGVDQLGGNPATNPIRASDWPPILRPIKCFAQPSDRGAGDVIARVIGPIGGEAFKIWYKAMFGKDCGCGHRQEVLNARWPL
jgi:hypothetical protein